MEKMNDFDPRDLILGVQNRDDEAFAELVRRYTPMINKVISEFRNSELREDEAFAEACVALHKAAMSYDVAQSEVTFGLYSRICVYRKLCDLVGKKRREESLVALDEGSFAVASSVESRLVGRETMQEALTFARSVLSDYEYQVFIYYLQGYTTSAIADELSKSAKSVDNAKARMFKRLREARSSFPDLN